MYKEARELFKNPEVSNAEEIEVCYHCLVCGAGNCQNLGHATGSHVR